MSTVDVARSWLDAVVTRDYDRVRSLLGDGIRLRDLSPPGFTELEGPDAVLGYSQGFLDMFETVELSGSDVYEIGGAAYVRARMRFVHAEAGERMLEQHHLLSVENGRVTAIDELCTGLFAP